MARRSIWIGIGAFILALLVSVAPSDRRIALSDISLGGSPAEAKGGHRPFHHRPYHRPDRPTIFDTLEDLDLDVDDGGGPDDDDGGPDDDAGPGDDDDGPNDDD